MRNLFVGTSGYNYKHWKNIFYPKDLPQKEWLSFYANYFNTVEINATFYRKFEKRVFEKWHKTTPSNFFFTIKGSRFITHVKRLNNVSDAISLFFEGAFSIKEKLAVVLWQFPASFHNTEENFKRLKEFVLILRFAQDEIRTRQAFEFRHSSWFTDEIYNLLNKNGAGFVINDSNYFPSKEVVTGDFVYIRFHGPASLYSSSYSDNQLKVWAKKIDRLADKKYDVYCYFNNDAFGHAVKNALALKSFF